MKEIIINVLFFCIGLICAFSLNNLKTIYNEQQYDLYNLIKIQHNIENIIDIETTNTTYTTTTKECLDNILDIAYSPYAYSKLRTIREQLIYIDKLDSQNITSSDIQYLVTINNKLKSYINNLNNYFDQPNLTSYIKVLFFDNNCKQIDLIFYKP